jgi:hypothetical protein
MQICSQLHVPAALSQEHTRFVGSIDRPDFMRRKILLLCWKLNPNSAAHSKSFQQTYKTIDHYKTKKTGQSQTYLILIGYYQHNTYILRNE